MFRKVNKKKPVQQVRTRKHSSDEEASTSNVVQGNLRKRRRENPMVQSTKIREKKAEGSSDSSSGDEEVVNEHAFAATREADALGPKDMGATATLDIDTDIAIDAQSQFERVQKDLKDGVEKDGKVLYKGQAMYGAKEAEDTIKGKASSGVNRIGPVRAPQFLRQTVRWDFAPDICKDYKETGYCTFGDSCKFMHDRSDYKHGWEIERDWLAGTLNEVDETNYEIPEEEETLPDACFICGNEFVDPVVTRCKHYFCQSCALTAFRKSKKCQVCNENTGGVFNVARDIIMKMAGITKKKGGEESEEEEENEEDQQENEENQENPENEDACCSHNHEGHDHHHQQEETIDQDQPEDPEEQPQDDEPQAEVEIVMEQPVQDDNQAVDDDNESDYTSGDEDKQ